MSLNAILYAGIGAISAAIALTVAVLGSTQPVAAPHLGLRGLKRHRARGRGGLFAACEPLLRFVAGWCRYLPLERRRLEGLLVRSGDYLGLTPEEFYALSFLTGSTGLAAGVLAGAAAGIPPAVAAVAGAGLGLTLPYFLVREEIDRRHREIGRSLPQTIEVIALCMGAGLDFPAALREVVSGSSIEDDPLREELQLILHALKLGHTRRRALETFAQRADSDDVKDFVAAVIQGEERGTPLADVLRTQGEMLRLRRGVHADKAATRAAVLMVIGPLVLLLLSVMLLVVGPLAIKMFTELNSF